MTWGSSSQAFRWVKGYSTVWGNEKADQLAKGAAGWIGPVPDQCILSALSYFKRAFKDFRFKKWKMRLETMDQQFSMRNKLWCPKPSFRKSRKKLALTQKVSAE